MAAEILNDNNHHTTIRTKIDEVPSVGEMSSTELIEMESAYGAHNYHPIPVVFERANGVHVWDPEGKHYYDFLSAYSAVNQGHCHPRIVQAMVDQASKCALSSRAFHNAVFPRFAKMATEMFGYDMMLPMNSGAEAVETAIKLARKWGYEKKGIPANEAVIISARGCFHGRTLAIISMSTDPDCRSTFGPFMTGMVQVDYNDLNQLREALETYGKSVCGFLVEPIQGEAGVVVPDNDYLSECYNLCKQHNVLFIGDEIQTGLARTGKLLCLDHSNVHPDILILGKAISGGMLPLSCVMSSKEIMLCIKPGEHGSTYGGSPLASAVGIAALEVIRDEKLAERAERLGQRLRAALVEMNAPFVQGVRGKGLLNAVIIDPQFSRTGWDICVMFSQRGLLAKPTHQNIIRLAPPLIITEEQMEECINIIRGVFEDVTKDSLESRIRQI
ncbi:ornithine-oxo-acid transaminase [Planoprotostelium fungivorum]|uniref:Ornithine aminotransferase n=1 Tax=Planoprotostelium fungivorum TaxID=1890364 RepID=A0A2P6NE50_9EUKA|nr:ornithine-oxo-acid transaminase [Planoprotostelium fungivorum]